MDFDRDLWVAYDAETCALYKAWKGGVRFEGAVYTSVHGPQPKSVGTSYTEGIAGPAWSAERAGRAVPLRARYRGHALRGPRASLEYELALADGATVTIEETPEFVRPEYLFSPEQREEGDLAEGLPGLARRFVLRGASDDLRIVLELRTDGVIRSPQAKEYNAAARMYGLVNSNLMWVMDMAAVGQPLQSHVSAELKRVG